MIELPRASVRHAHHPRGGWNVVHRKSKVILGCVVLWPDGIWIVYLPYVDENCGEGGTREDATAKLLHRSIHEPGGFELHDGKGWDDYVRDATEVEGRRLDPKAWEHWDRVRPLFEPLDI